MDWAEGCDRPVLWYPNLSDTVLLNCSSAAGFARRLYATPRGFRDNAAAKPGIAEQDRRGESPRCLSLDVADQDRRGESPRCLSLNVTADHDQSYDDITLCSPKSIFRKVLGITSTQLLGSICEPFAEKPSWTCSVNCCRRCLVQISLCNESDWFGTN